MLEFATRLSRQKFPDIQIDYDRCTVPMLCKKCLQVCPQAVFQVGVVKIEKYRETDKTADGAYRLAAPYRHKCIMCNDCITVCPAEAINVVAP